MYYILDNKGEPVFQPDIHQWSEWYERARGPDLEHDPRRVAISRVGVWRISTVFLALDHAFGEGPPVLWETMVFGPEPWDGWQERYTSKADAEVGHKRIYDLIRTGAPPPDVDHGH